MAAGQQLGLPYEAEVLNKCVSESQGSFKMCLLTGSCPTKNSFSEGGGGEGQGGIRFSNMSPGDFKAPS